MKLLAVLCFLVGTAGSVNAAVPSADSIPNFVQVTPDLYRGGIPGQDGIAYLAKIGVKTILDMETTDSEISSELESAAASGLVVMSVQLPPLALRPTHRRMDEVIAVLKDPSNYPLFVHCRHGQDRTGVAVGLYRVYVQGWTPADAYKEMIARGFHPDSEIGLRCYFDEKTGLRAPSICAFIPAYDPK